MRISMPEQTTYPGTFGGFRGDTLLFIETGSDKPKAIPLSAIDDLERSRGRRGHSLAGAGLGLCAGAITGAMLGAREQPHDWTVIFTGTHVAEESAFALGIAAGAAGALVGTFWRTENWRSVPRKELPVGVRIGGHGVTVGWQF